MNSLVVFCNGLRPWRCSGGLDAGHHWRWITGRPGLEESFKRVKEGIRRWAGCLISWMRLSTSIEALLADEVAGTGKVEGKN